MAVHPIATDTLPRSAPRRTVPSATVIAIGVPTPRHRLFGGLIEAGCELIALGAEAACALVASREPDALADAHVRAIQRIAQRGAEESLEIHGCPCWRRFARIDQHGQGYHTADDAEDGWIGKTLSAIGRIVTIVRGVNRALERELAKRGRRGARP